MTLQEIEQRFINQNQEIAKQKANVAAIDEMWNRAKKMLNQMEGAAAALQGLMEEERNMDNQRAAAANAARENAEKSANVTPIEEAVKPEPEKVAGT